MKPVSQVLCIASFAMPFSSLVRMHTKHLAKTSRLLLVLPNQPLTFPTYVLMLSHMS